MCWCPCSIIESSLSSLLLSSHILLLQPGWTFSALFLFKLLHLDLTLITPPTTSCFWCSIAPSPAQPLVGLLRNGGWGWILEEGGDQIRTCSSSGWIQSFPLELPNFPSEFLACIHLRNQIFTKQRLHLSPKKLHVCNPIALNYSTKLNTMVLPHIIFRSIRWKQGNLHRRKGNCLFVVSTFDWFLHQLRSLPGVPAHQRLWRWRNKEAAILDKASQGP